uniref:Uncharacterized protein n=1 Tax=viral metagenome TaxID=1070528 RepID=A0A6C0HR66_9ZZZZ
MAHIYQGFQGEYYVVAGIKYDCHFPQEWATNHKEFQQEVPFEDYILLTGPENCENCAFYGMLRGVFVGYCRNCAREYNFERGNSFDFDFTQEEMWEKLDYMKNVKINTIGDEEISEPEIKYDFEIKENRKRHRKRHRKAQKEPKEKQKKSVERKHRRALRFRRNNEEYIGMPAIESSATETYIFLGYLFMSISIPLMILYFILIQKVSS